MSADDNFAAAERRGYEKGYKAGLRKAQADRFERVFLSILNGLISTNKQWEMGDQQVTESGRYVDLARSFAREAVKALTK